MKRRLWGIWCFVFGCKLYEVLGCGRCSCCGKDYYWYFASECTEDLHWGEVSETAAGTQDSLQKGKE
jgi:hypothetical protein